MYHPRLAEKRLEKLIDQVRLGGDPTFLPKDRPLEEVWAIVSHLESIVDSEKGLLRPLKPEEERFILEELTKCKASFMYFAQFYCKIKTKAAELEPIRFLESQEIILKHIGDVEWTCFDGSRGDGLIVLIDKARQLGCSTICEAMLAHRAFFYGNLTSVVAGDVPEQSAYLFDMIERIYDHLPWWMKPERDYHVKDAEMFFGKIDSLVKVYSGKSVRGGDSMELGKGQMGRGKTINLAHLSELSTWANPEQLDDSFFPAVPPHPRTLAVLESTARGRGNWWHDAWILARRGLGRAVPIFIPWYAETKTYTRPCPTGWVPSDLALAHARKALEVSAKWCGRTIALTKDQLYWWEITREEYKAKRKLSMFLSEYAADDLESFQNTTQGVFGSDLVHELRQESKPLVSLLEVKPRLAAQEQPRG
jgi:hypothetical protein